jgi:hypothetical protein
MEEWQCVNVHRVYATNDDLRGLALFLGTFTLVNLIGELRGASFDTNVWWIELAGLPRGISAFVLTAFAIAMIVWSFVPRRRIINIALMIVVPQFAIIDAIRYYIVLARGEIQTAIPIPLSLLIAMTLALLLAAQFRDPERASRQLFVAAFIAAAILFPLAQVALFGATDYRRPADVIVVFGARAYEDGRMSSPLADRVHRRSGRRQDRRAVGDDALRDRARRSARRDHTRQPRREYGREREERAARRARDRRQPLLSSAAHQDDVSAIRHRRLYRSRDELALHGECLERDSRKRGVLALLRARPHYSASRIRRPMSA